MPSNHVPWSRQDGIHALGVKGRAQRSREDATGLLLAKLVDIAENKSRPFEEALREIASDEARAAECMRALISLVVQYSTRSGTYVPGLMVLINFLTNQLDEKELLLPGNLS